VALADDVDRCFDHIGQVCLRGLQGDTQVGHDPFGLSGHIADRDDGSALIERAGPGGEDQP
jgi:hypothetical protein